MGILKCNFRKSLDPFWATSIKTKFFFSWDESAAHSYSGSKQSIGQANNTFASAVQHEIKYFMKMYSHFHVLSFSCAFIFICFHFQDFFSNFHLFDQITLLPHEYLMKMNINSDEKFLSENISFHCAAGSCLL